MQLNSILFAKTLTRKNVALPGTSSKPETGTADASKTSEGKDEDEGDFSSKAQVMTLMTTDVDRVSDTAWNLYALIGLL
jgi:hypothetical protein